LETFFTLQHGLFFTGALSTATLLSVTAIQNHRKGYPWESSLPRIYLVSLLAIAGFFVGLTADMFYHIFFGIEKDLAIIISPPHMLIAVGSITATMSICRIIWSADGHPAGTPRYVLILLLTYMTMAFNYMTDYVNPFAFPYMAKSFAESRLYVPQIGEVAVTPQLAEILGFGNIVLFTSFFMGVILMSIRYWRPPFGTFTVVFTLNIAAVILAYGRYYWFIAPAAVAGLLADLIYHHLVPRYPEDHRGVRLFAFAVPVILFSGHALTILVTDRTIWSWEMWGGTILISGLVGCLRRRSPRSSGPTSGTSRHIIRRRSRATRSCFAKSRPCSTRGERLVTNRSRSTWRFRVTPTLHSGCTAKRWNQTSGAPED
jgi:hypothetical protein